MASSFYVLPLSVCWMVCWYVENLQWCDWLNWIIKVILLVFTMPSSLSILKSRDFSARIQIINAKEKNSLFNTYRIKHFRLDFDFLSFILRILTKKSHFNFWGTVSWSESVLLMPGYWQDSWCKWIQNDLQYKCTQTGTEVGINSRITRVAQSPVYW
jgi:hypothetical protein